MTLKKPISTLNKDIVSCDTSPHMIKRECGPQVGVVKHFACVVLGLAPPPLQSCPRPCEVQTFSHKSHVVIQELLPFLCIRTSGTHQTKADTICCYFNKQVHVREGNMVQSFNMVFVGYGTVIQHGFWRLRH